VGRDTVCAELAEPERVLAGHHGRGDRCRAGDVTELRIDLFGNLTGAGVDSTTKEAARQGAARRIDLSRSVRGSRQRQCSMSNRLPGTVEFVNLEPPSRDAGRLITSDDEPGTVSADCQKVAVDSRSTRCGDDWMWLGREG